MRLVPACIAIAPSSARIKRTAEKYPSRAATQVPSNTGITAAVKRLEVRCTGSRRQVLPVVMPHSEGWQDSTTVRFQADTGASCTFSLLQGFNMSDLAQFAHYTGAPPAPVAKANANRKAAIRRPVRPRPMANGGVTGPLNSAQIGALRIAPVAAEGEAP